jgi:hypothetical protein
MAMLDGIEMHVIHMPAVIVLVADGMLPEASLPDAPFPATPSAC